MDKEKDVDIISQVKKCLSDSGGGYTDLDAVNKIDRLLYKLSAESQSQSYVSEKIASIKSFARILSSDRKHTKYPGEIGRAHV